MSNANPHLDTLQDIKQMMERSSRFISLSGFSGIAAGTCALVGAWFARDVINNHYNNSLRKEIKISDAYNDGYSVKEFMGNQLFFIALITFISALILAFVFTYVRSKKNHIPVWGASAKRLMFNVSIPMLVGGIYLIKLMEAGNFGLIAPGCLLFYGLALVNGSKYTLGEVRYLGYGQIILGIVNLSFVGNGLYFWAMGFGVLHIIYGVVMWWKYERTVT